VSTTVLHSYVQTLLGGGIASSAAPESPTIGVRFIPFGVGCLWFFGAFLVDSLFCLLPTLPSSLFKTPFSSMPMPLLQAGGRETSSATTVVFG
jgi:hypothetical protein